MSWINDLADALGFGNNKQTDDAQQTLDEMLARANGVSAQNRGLIRDYYDQMNGTFSEGASKYNEAVASLADAIAHQGDYDKTVKENVLKNLALEVCLEGPEQGRPSLARG